MQWLEFSWQRGTKRAPSPLPRWQSRNRGDTGANAGTVSLISINRPIVFPLTSLFITLIPQGLINGKAVIDDDRILDGTIIIDPAEVCKRMSQHAISLFHRWQAAPYLCTTTQAGRARYVVTPTGRFVRHSGLGVGQRLAKSAKQ